MFTITDKIKSTKRFLKVRAEFKPKASPCFCNGLTHRLDANT